MKITPSRLCSATYECISVQYDITFHPPCFNGSPEPSGKYKEIRLGEATVGDRVLPPPPRANRLRPVHNESQHASVVQD